MHEFIEIYHKAVLSLLVALCIVLLKRLAEKRFPTLDDANDVAWTLIMMSIGAVAVYAREWTDTKVDETLSWIALLALLLIFNRRRRIRTLAVVGVAGNPITLLRLMGACTELVIGLAATIITIK